MANEEPSKEVLLLVDVVLEKYPYQPMHSLAMIQHIMSGQQQKFDNETFNTLAQFAYSNSKTIRDFLLKEGYLKCIDWRIPTDELTDKGRLAKEKGGHAKFKEWEAEEARKAAFEDFPKKKWHIYEPLKSIFIFLLGAALTKFACSTSKENNDQKPPQVKEQPSISPTPPKISDTTNKVK